MSQLPIFWEAVTDTGNLCQVDSTGRITERWQDLKLDTLVYWGLVCQQGRYGFFPRSNQCRMNGTRFKVGPRCNDEETSIVEACVSNPLEYKRTVEADVSTGEMITIQTRIAIGPRQLIVLLHPEFEVVLVP